MKYGWAEDVALKELKEQRTWCQLSVKPRKSSQRKTHWHWILEDAGFVGVHQAEVTCRWRTDLLQRLWRAWQIGAEGSAGS
ncbi:hypothetical protein ACRRTK_020821 [Alexandromys fortis]